MALGLSAAAWGAIAAGTSVAVSAVGLEQSREAGRSAAHRANDAAAAADQQFNKLNGKRPDLDTMSASEAMSARNGPSGTLLTGAGGVDPSQLLLGKSTLLGG